MTNEEKDILDGEITFPRQDSIQWQIQFSLVAQSCLTLCYPMNYSITGLPVHHQLPEFIQTHVHWVGDVI